MLKLSLIIPVYNEEHHIRRCLDAVSEQSVMPGEVVIVDNNCTDDTISIVKEYDFVTIVKEKDQGRGHARSAGFNVAKHDILGRIDADSQIDADWVERVVQRFSGDKELMGLTGLGRTVLFPIVPGIKLKIMPRAYFWFVHAGFNTITMWGANMAIRKDAWNVVKSKVCMDDKKVHEDQDLSLWIATSGGKIKQDNNVLITTGTQMYRYLPKLLNYSDLFCKTKRMHIENGNLRGSEMRHIGAFRVIPGFLVSLFLTSYIFIVSVLFFPIDYIILRYTNNKTWLG